jgi:hypothetical protein
MTRVRLRSTFWQDDESVNSRGYNLNVYNLIVSVGWQTVAALTFNYKIFKDEPVLVFNCRDAGRYYWSRIRKLLRLGSSEESTETESSLPPVSEVLGFGLVFTVRTLRASVIYCDVDRPFSRILL